MADVTAVAHGVHAPPVKAAIGNQQNINDGVGLLRGFDGALKLLHAALVFAIGKNDDGLAAGLLLQLLMRGTVDSVVEQRALRRARRHAAATAGADIDLRLVHGAGQRVRIVGVVGEKVDIHIERDKKRFIFRTQNAAQKSSAGLLLQRQNILLASAGIEQDSQGEGLIVLGGEVLDLLRRLCLPGS